MVLCVILGFLNFALMKWNWHLVVMSISVVLLILPLYSYLLYPFILKRLKKSYPIKVSEVDLRKRVLVFIAAYNEEKVMVQKLESIIGSSYPTHLINVWVGSDASTDLTDSIVLDYSKRFPQIHLCRMEGRLGKPEIINRLYNISNAQNDNEAILILTDANVFFEKQMIQTLVNGFHADNVQLIGANVINTSAAYDNTGSLEEKYISRENKIKQGESDWKGVLMGPFGACFAMRSNAFETIPSNFLVDDFFWCLNVLKNGGKACFESKAICFEDLPGNWKEEFRRKRRIAYGNFQNLGHFKKMVLKFWTPIGFAFWSHKGLRWFGPLFVMIAFSLQPLMVFELFLDLLCLGVLLEGISRLLVINRGPLRAILYFCQMNVAVFLGMIDFLLKRRKNANWQPTQRKV